MHRLTRFLVCAALVPCFTSAVHAAVTYQVTDLGQFTSGSALNDAGQVVGAARHTPPGGTAALDVPFVYANGKITYLPLPAGATSGRATGINSTGEVVGTFMLPGDVSRAFRYANGVVSEIAAPAGFTGTSAAGINDAGVVAGTLLPLSGPNGSAPFIFSNGVVTPLTLPASALGGRALRINNAGQVLGGYTAMQDGQVVSRHFVRTGGEGDEILVPPGYARIDPRAINSAGDVAGTAYRPPNQFGLDAGRPFVVHDGTLRLLPLPFGSATDSAVIGENDRGDLVGYAGRGFIEPIAFVDGEWLDLNTASTRPDGYSVFAPLAINNNGQIIASAMGPDLGVDRTFLLTPVPEPGAVGVLALAMGATLRRRRRG